MTDDLRLAWQGAGLHGLTPVGRTTILVPARDDPLMVKSREALIASGRFPPR